MEYQLLPKAVATIRNILDYDNLPQGRAKDLIADVKGGFKHVKLINQRNYLEKMVSKNIATKEVQSLAKQIIHTTNKNYIRKEEKRIMKSSIVDKNR